MCLLPKPQAPLLSCWRAGRLTRGQRVSAGVPGTAAKAGFQQFNCIVNTVLSLLGATVATFVASAAVYNKFDMARPPARPRLYPFFFFFFIFRATCVAPAPLPRAFFFVGSSWAGAGCCPVLYTLTSPRGRAQVHIQNATLAGGVAIGSAANLVVTPGGALAVGVAAGLLSVAGYARLSPRLEAGLGLHDTCGVHNLHGMPGVLGGLVAAAVAAISPGDNAPVLKHAGRTQARCAPGAGPAGAAARAGAARRVLLPARLTAQGVATQPLKQGGCKPGTCRRMLRAGRPCNNSGVCPALGRGWS